MLLVYGQAFKAEPALCLDIMLVLYTAHHSAVEYWPCLGHSHGRC